MKTIPILIIILLLSACSDDRISHVGPFVKVMYHLNDEDDSLEFSRWVEENFEPDSTFKPCSYPGIIADFPYWYCFYEDEDYRAYRYCLGEFGGELLFQDKKNPEMLYAMRSYHPMFIVKSVRGYYVSEFEIHLGTSGNIFRIKDPRELFAINQDSLIKYWSLKGYYDIPYSNEWKEKNYRKTLRKRGDLVYGKLDLWLDLLFKENDKLYFIHSDDNGTSNLSEIRDSSVILIDTLINGSYFDNSINWRYYSRENEIRNDIYHYHFALIGIEMKKNINHSRFTITGRTFVKNDTIVIGIKTRRHRSLTFNEKNNKEKISPLSRDTSCFSF